MPDLKCPKCGSEDVFQKKDGGCLCGECGHRFVPQQEPTEFVPMRLFISYGHKESEICRRIYDALKNVRHHDPWFDEDEIRFGHDWRERIAKGIEESNSVVACLSQYSTREKGVCLDELAISVGVKGGNIVSVLLEDVTPPASVSHRQWLDMRGWKEKLDAGEDVFRPWFDAKMAELYAVLESKENREFSGQITELQKRLTVYYSTSRQEKLLRNAFVGRAWLDTEVAAWLQDDTAPRTCLLTGAPGVGKSAYAAHFAHYKDSVAAALFCSSEMNTFNDPRTVIQTLAYLMACRLPAYRRSLMLHLPEDRAAVERLSEKELFEQLISKPLSLSIDGHHERMVILLDGLDECGSPEKNTLAKTLYEYADSLPDWLRIMIVARDIPAISVYTKGARRIEIGSESKDNLQDIQDYYRYELESRFGDDPQWADALERMTARSQGIFLYAQMLTDLLCSRGTLGAAEEYPDGLDAVFTRWFSWFFSDSDFRSFWRPAISCILGAPAPLPAETLRRVMHWGENELADFRARLKVLLRAEKNEFDDEVLVFDHAFVREWLTRGAGENVYFCSPKDGAEKLAGEVYDIFERDPEELTFWEAVHLMELPLWEGQREKAVESLKLDDKIEDAGDYCETWGKYDQAEEIYDKALTVVEERDPKMENEDSQRNIARYLQHKGGLALTRGKIAQSMELENKALEIMRNLVEKNPSGINLMGLSACYARIGDGLEKKGKIIEALEMYRKSLEICEKLSCESGTSESRGDLAAIYIRVGDILQKQGNFIEALEMYRQSLDIDEKLSTELGTPQSQSDLSLSYNRVGDILQEQGNFINALEMYRQSLDIDEKLSTELGTPQSRSNLAVSYSRVGYILQEQGNFVGALEKYHKSLEIRKELSHELGTPQSQSDLSLSYNRVGDILRERGNFVGALEMYCASLTICKKLSHEFDTPQLRSNLSLSYNLVGDILQKQGNFIEALEMYRQSLDIDEKLSTELGTPQSRSNLSISYNCVGGILHEQGDFIGALKMYRKSLEICKKLNLELGTPKSRRDLAISYSKVGDILHEQGDFIGALKMYRKSLAIDKKLRRELDTPQSKRDLIISYERVGDILREQGNFVGALEMYRASFAICEKLSHEFGTPQSRQDLSVISERVGDVLHEQGDFIGALKMYRKSLEISENLNLELGTLQSQRDLAVSYSRVGDILKEQGDFIGALEMYHQSLVIFEKLSHELGTPSTYHDEMAACTNIGTILLDQEKYEEALQFAKRALAISEELAAQLNTDAARKDVEMMRENLDEVESHCKKS